MKRVLKGYKRKIPFLAQSNLFITDTKETGISGGVRFREIGLYIVLRDQMDCP